MVEVTITIVNYIMTLTSLQKHHPLSYLSVDRLDEQAQPTMVHFLPHCRTEMLQVDDKMALEAFIGGFNILDSCFLIPITRIRPEEMTTYQFGATSTITFT